MKRLILALVLLALSTQAFSADPVWKQRTQSGNIREVIFADNRFVAVGSAGSAIYISDDGKEWEVFDKEGDYTFLDIVYGNGRFVAVSTSGDYGYSLNGIDWVTGTGSRFYDVIFGNGVFVAVGRDGVIGVSPDGETWTLQTSGTTEDLYGVTFGNNEFVAVGYTSTLIRSSDDGASWLPVIQDGSSALASGQYSSIVYLDNRYYLGSNNGDNYTGKQIGNWSLTSVDVSEAGLDAAMGIATDGFTFVNYRGQRSHDGLIWTQAVFNNTQSIAYGNGAFVTVGEFGDIYSSEDGISWDQHRGNRMQVTERGAVIYAEGRFISTRPNDRLNTSYDGLEVDHSTLVLGSNDDFLDILYNGSLYVAVTDDGAIYSSDDGLVWIERLPEEDSLGFNAVASGGGRFVAVGREGTVFTSSDGLSWSDAASAVIGIKTLNTVAYGPQGFVAAGNQGVLFTSPDGLVWTGATSGTSSILTKVVYGHGQYMVVGDSGTHLSSVDAVNWTNTDTGSTRFKDVTVTATGFVAVGSSYTVSSSTDGVSWEDVRISSGGTLYKVVPAGDAVFAYGSSSSFTLGDFVPGSSPVPLPELHMRDRRSSWGAWDMAFGNGRFVAVGGSGTESSSGSAGPISMVSVDGKQWRMTYDTPYKASSILFQSGRFIAVAAESSGSPIFLYSLDGLTWTTGNIYKDVGTIRALEYVNGLYFAVGSNGLIMSSTDGIDWVVAHLKDISTFPLETIGFTNGRFLATGNSTKVLFSDNNGTNWTEQTTLQVNEDTTTTAILLRDVYVNGDRFFGYSSAGRHSSSDGVTWTLPGKLSLTDEGGVQTTGLSTLSSNFGGSKYAGGLHVAYTGTGYFTTSRGGLEWVRRQGDFGSASNDDTGADFGYKSEFHLAYGNNTYVIMSDDDSDRVFSTDNGITWQRVAPLDGEGIRYINGNLLRGIAFGSSLQISNNLGVTWSTIYDATNSGSRSDIIDIAFGDNVYVAICHGTSAVDATFYTSADAHTWVENDGFDLVPNSIIYANGQFVAVGDVGLIRTSADGINWETRDSGTAQNLEEVIWGHAGFVAVGANNVILTSPDAIDWTAQSAPYDDNFTAVGYRAGVYITTGKNQIFRSTDGISWTRQLLMASNTGFQAVAEGTLGFLASSDGQGTWQSTDGGVHWWKVSDQGVTTNNELTQAGGRVFFSKAMDNRNDGIAAINDLPTTIDSDGDGIPDTTDNCPDDSNSDQLNNDGDSQGNVCDAYPDDAYDNAPPPSPTITVTLPDGRRVTGSIFTFTAEGFKPFTLVQAFIQSDPIFVGEEIADKDGKVSFTIVLPLELPLGDHTLILQGQNSGN